MLLLYRSADQKIQRNTLAVAQQFSVILVVVHI